jgi:hypothetical protein
MKSGDPPTKEELEVIRQKLILQIKEAQLLFDTENKGHELLTSRAALAGIEQLIRRVRNRKQPSRDVA